MKPGLGPFPCSVHSLMAGHRLRAEPFLSTHNPARSLQDPQLKVRSHEPSKAVAQPDPLRKLAAGACSFVRRNQHYKTKPHQPMGLLADCRERMLETILWLMAAMRSWVSLIRKHSEKSTGCPNITTGRRKRLRGRMRNESYIVVWFETKSTRPTLWNSPVPARA